MRQGAAGDWEGLGILDRTGIVSTVSVADFRTAIVRWHFQRAFHIGIARPDFDRHTGPWPKWGR